MATGSFQINKNKKAHYTMLIIESDPDKIEEYERKLSKVQNVYVKITIEFNHKQKLKSGATIPSGFYKTIIIKV